jgi:ferredoxin
MRHLTTVSGNKNIKVNIFFPTLHETREYSAAEGETIQSIAQREPQLQEHLVCSCGGNAACSTCHVYVDPHFYGLLRSPDDEETDMLDLAYGYREGVSRLGCRIHLSKELDGIKLALPEGSNNLF